MKPRIDEYSSIMRMSELEFLEVAKLVYSQFGINLTESKKILAESRLNSVLRERKISSFSEYLKILKSDTTGKELIELANRISTNHTYFYREKEHFEYMQKEILPKLFSQNFPESQIRIWSAPCSSGEEAYTIAMTVHDYMLKNHLINEKTIKILGTDISLPALKKAKEAIYPKEEITHLPAEWQKRYFLSREKDQCEIDPNLREYLSFGRLNFMEESFPFKKKFHTIFCRNVMIYFDTPTKETLVKNLHSFLEKDGYFIISLSESLPHTTKKLFEQESHSIFRKI